MILNLFAKQKPSRSQACHDVLGLCTGCGFLVWTLFFLFQIEGRANPQLLANMGNEMWSDWMYQAFHYWHTNPYWSPSNTLEQVLQSGLPNMRSSSRLVHWLSQTCPRSKLFRLNHSWPLTSSNLESRKHYICALPMQEKLLGRLGKFKNIFFSWHMFHIYVLAHAWYVDIAHTTL